VRSDDLTPDLESLVRDPRRATDVPLDAVPALLDVLAVHEGRLGVVKAVLAARLMATTGAGATRERPYTLTEAADLLLKSPAWLRRQARAGIVLGAKKVGKTWVFPRTEFHRFCDRRQVG
jgi:hypothetical protein